MYATEITSNIKRAEESLNAAIEAAERFWQAIKEAIDTPEAQERAGQTE